MRQARAGGEDLGSAGAGAEDAGAAIARILESASMARAEFSCSVRVQALPEHTQEPAGPYAYAYTVTIRNTGEVAAQLVARRWLVSDAHGHVEEVRGLAVVGRQPLLKPGEAFEYTSWTRIATPHGSMQGTFYCMTEDAHAFEAPVPAFTLGEAASLH
ncbi:MAG: protein apaG [Pseudomonadota bacterium]